MNQVPDWLAACCRAAQQPQLQPRWLFEIDGRVVGSVAPTDAAWLAELDGLSLEDDVLSISPICGFDASAVLAEMASCLRANDRCGPWRNELLAVSADDGTVLGHIERAAVRVLGLRTQAVHLNGYSTDGRTWLQQRALNKAQDPGMWDTLVGGMVASGEDLRSSLTRETWEEAGLNLAALSNLQRGRSLHFERPEAEGWMIEDIAVFDAVLPLGMVPENQDGEVAQFRLVTPQELSELLAAGALTQAATLVIAESMARRGELSSAAQALVQRFCTHA
jgi:isopentenyldiphosphate isomerase